MHYRNALGFAAAPLPLKVKPSVGYMVGTAQAQKLAKGRASQIAANTKHGRETRAIREERSAKLAELYELEMLGRKMGLISGPMVGRKLR